MSIHNFSREGFYEAEEEILRDTLSIKDDVVITPALSFKYDLDMSSIEVAEFLEKIEEKYKIDLGFVQPSFIDNIEDTFKIFKWAVKLKRQKYALSEEAYKQREIAKYENNPVYQDVKSIVIELDPALKDQNLSPLTDIENDMKFDYLDRIELIMKLEEKYNIAVPDNDILFNMPTLGEFTDRLVSFNKPTPKRYAKEMLVNEISGWLIDAGLIKSVSSGLQTPLNPSKADKNLISAINMKYNINLKSFIGLGNLNDLCEAILRERLHYFRVMKRVHNNHVLYGSETIKGYKPTVITVAKQESFLKQKFNLLLANVKQKLSNIKG